ncbi:MAG: hypothetical protein ACXWF8_01585 [Methylobacter sp.]
MAEINNLETVLKNGYYRNEQRYRRHACRLPPIIQVIDINKANSTQKYNYEKDPVGSFATLQGL